MNTSRRQHIQTLAALGGALGLSPIRAFAQAEKYPTKPVNIVVPYSPGAATDTLARFVSEQLGKDFKQTFIVENRAGGGTTIGSRQVAMAPADGYTLGMVDTAFVINPGLLGKQLPYDSTTAFAPISLVCTASLVMVVHPSVKATDLQSFIKLAKANPGSLTYGSAGVGSAPHLAGEQLRQAAGIDVIHVPYRGGATVFTDLLGGHIQFAFATIPSLLKYITSGQLRALAATSSTRYAELPDVQTMSEAGYPKVDTQPMFGLVAPGKTPKPIVDELSKAIAASIKSGNLGKRLTEQNFVPVGSTPEEFSKRITTDIAKWTEVIRVGGIKPE